MPCMTDVPDSASIDDPTMRAMVAVANDEYTGESGDGTAQAVVRGDLGVVSVAVGTPDMPPGLAAQRLAEAVNAGLESARTATRAKVLGIPGLDPELRSVLAGTAQMTVDEEAVEVEVDPSRLRRDFSGYDGDVVVSVSGLTQEVTSIFLPDLHDDTLARVPRATNRAMAAARLAHDGATPLDEQIDGVLDNLDEKLSAVEARLDGVEDILDALSRDLGD